MSKAAKTKEFIIEKTAHLFNCKGYAGTSINDLTEATGLTKGSIYGNFENKDEVALAAFDYNFQNVINYLKSKMDARESMIGKLLVYPETYRNFSKISILNSGCPLTNTAVDSDDTHPLLKAKAAQAYLFWKESVERQVKAGIETGEIKPDTNVNEFISVLLSLIQGGVLQAKATGKTTSLNLAMDYLEKLINQLKK